MKEILIKVSAHRTEVDLRAEEWGCQDGDPVPTPTELLAQIKGGDETDRLDALERVITLLLVRYISIGIEQSARYGAVLNALLELAVRDRSSWAPEIVKINLPPCQLLQMHASLMDVFAEATRYSSDTTTNKPQRDTVRKFHAVMSEAGSGKDFKLEEVVTSLSEVFGELTAQYVNAPRT